MRTEEERQADLRKSETELRTVRSGDWAYLEPWVGLTPNQRWVRAMVWADTPGEVHVTPDDQRSYVLRGTIVGPATQEEIKAYGDYLVVDIDPLHNRMGSRPKLHLVRLRLVTKIAEMPEDAAPGLDRHSEL